MDGGGLDAFNARIAEMAQWVDAMNSTDNTAAHAHASNVAVAIAQRRFVCVAFDTGADPDTMTLTTGATAGCGAALQSPTGDPAYVVNAPANTTFAAVPANFSFDPQGSPSFAVTSTVTVTDAANPITIEAETGYVH